MSNAILFRMAAGIPGTVSRPSFSAIEGQPFDPTTPCPGYGIPIKLVNGKVQPISTAADIVYGFLVRPYPTTGADASDPIGTAVPPTSGMASVARIGYLTVVSNAGAAAQGGAVYVRYASGTAGTPIGGVEADAVASTTMAIPGAQFMSGADANGNVEISFGL